jgi:predicted regulator of Ras-like GTPase activity (Roadblock/LC7/MglB family)
MTTLKDSSEIREARDLLLLIMGGPVLARPARPQAAPPPAPAPPFPSLAVSTAATASVSAPSVLPAPLPEPEPMPVVEQWVAVPDAAVEQSPSEVQVSEARSRGNQLQDALARLCTRAGLGGALIADTSGLAVAASSQLAASENLAAFSTVLGDVLHKAGSYLGQEDATDVSIDINARQKVVLRRFALEGRPFYLLVLCDAGADPRAAMRDAVPEILSILAVT